MTRKPPNSGKAWTERQLQDLQRLAGGNAPTRIIALKIGRTPAAIQNKASQQNISLKAT